jgi:hypothetical protein
MDESSPSATKSVQNTMLPWVGIGLLLVFEYGLFRQYAEREVVWCYPTVNDQAAYLSRSYRYFEKIGAKGLINGVVFGLRDKKPNGAVVEVEASLLYLFLGASRLSALTLNFAHFALLQVVLAGTVRWYSGRWSPAFMGVGLLLTAGSPFYFAGGIMDFRIDFIAFCLVGVFVCVVIRSGVFQSWRWSIVAGAVAGHLVLSRYLTAVYLAGILGLFFVLFCAQWVVRRDSAVRGRVVRRLGGLLLTCVILGMAVAPAIMARWRAIHLYYVQSGMEAEGAIRYQDVGVADPVSRLLFYPRSVLFDHAGWRFLILSGLCLAGALVAGRVRRAQSYSVIPGETAPAQPVLAAVGFAASCVLVPLCILTLVSSPSPVVASAVVAPLLWVVLGCVLWLLGPLAAMRGTARRGATILATVAVLAGAFTQAQELAKRSWISVRRAECAQVLQLYDEIGDQCRRLGWTEPRITMNTLSDHLYPVIVGPTVYERQGLLLTPRYPLGFAVTSVVADDEAIRAVNDSDFVVLALTEGTENDNYPFVRRMRELRPKMLAACESSLVRLRTFRLFGQEVALFMRPSVRVEGATEDRWITDQGLNLLGDANHLRSYSRVELRGRIDPAQNPCANASARAELIAPGQAPQNIPASVSASSLEYRITIDMRPEEVPAVPTVRIHLSFDRYLVPSDHAEIFGANPDHRRLVLPAPDYVTLLACP